MKARIGLAAGVIAVLCGCEPKPEVEQHVVEQEAVDGSPAVIVEPPRDPELIAGEGPTGAVGRTARRQAVIDLLTDGQTAGALELSATDPGKPFDPRLAETLTPKVWVSDRPHSKALPSVKPGKVEASAGLDRDVIRRIIRSHINELRSCYAAGLSKHPKLAGDLTIEFVIIDGRVPVSTIAKTTLSDESTGNCFAKAIRRWSFPKPVGGATVNVSYSFKLSR